MRIASSLSCFMRQIVEVAGQAIGDVLSAGFLGKRLGLLAPMALHSAIAVLAGSLVWSIVAQVLSFFGEKEVVAPLIICKFGSQLTGVALTFDPNCVRRNLFKD